MISANAEIPCNYANFIPITRQPNQSQIEHFYAANIVRMFWYRNYDNTGLYGYPRVNVANEKEDPASLLNAIKQFIRFRKACPEQQSPVYAAGVWL